MRFNPIILYWWDRFQQPVPFHPMIVVSVDSAFTTKIEMLHQHESQVYEWLPWVDRDIDSVPADPERRKAWLGGWYASRHTPSIAESYRDRLRARYGDSAGDKVIEAEAFELCEYGTQLTEAELESLFEDFG